jgi:hypothetical protein
VSVSDGLTGCSECGREIDLTAVCERGLVTGGGFSCPTCRTDSRPGSVNIKVNEPLQDLSGWHVVGTYFSHGSSADFTVYAICAQSQ